MVVDGVVEASSVVVVLLLEALVVVVLGVFVVKHHLDKFLYRP